MATKANKEATPAVAEAAFTAITTPLPKLQSTSEEGLKLPCAREYFYKMALNAWGYCLADRLLFMEVSERYTEAFIQGQVDFINTVKNLPDLSVLQAAATEANEGLAAWRQQVGSLSKRLDNAIGYAFKNPDTADAERQLAGLNEFGTPSAEPWAQVDKFLTKANNYLTTKMTVLVDAKAATANLQTKFTDVTTGFSAAWADFIFKEKKVVDGTKVTKNGLIDILAELNPMLNDGKLIYEFDATNRKKFTIKDLVREVRGTHPAGLAGYVFNEQGRGVEGVLVAAIGQTDKFAITDKKGYYKINLAAGEATFLYSMEGMEPQSFSRTLTAGVTSRQNVVLVPVEIAPEAVAAPVEEAIVAETPQAPAAVPENTKEDLVTAVDLLNQSPSSNGAAKGAVV